MNKIKVVKAKYRENQNFDDEVYLKYAFLNVMKVHLFYENESVLLWFGENDFKKWELTNVMFVDKDNNWFEDILYDLRRQIELGEKRVDEIKGGIKSQVNVILNDQKVRLKKIMK